jgi:hypothetical protein
VEVLADVKAAGIDDATGPVEERPGGWEEDERNVSLGLLRPHTMRTIEDGTSSFPFRLFPSHSFCKKKEGSHSDFLGDGLPFRPGCSYFCWK